GEYVVDMRTSSIVRTATRLVADEGRSSAARVRGLDDVGEAPTVQTAIYGPLPARASDDSRAVASAARSVANDPVEGRRLGAQVAPAAERRGRGEERVAGAQHRGVVAHGHLHESRGDGDELRALVDERRLAVVVAAEGDEVGAQAEDGVVGERGDAGVAAVAAVVPGELIAR